MLLLLLWLQFQRNGLNLLSHLIESLACSAVYIKSSWANLNKAPFGPNSASSSTLMSVSVLSPDERPSVLLDVPVVTADPLALAEVGSVEVAGDSVSSREEFGVALNEWKGSFTVRFL